jgi:hypothetical protein
LKERPVVKRFFSDPIEVPSRGEQANLSDFKGILKAVLKAGWEGDGVLRES